jgi:hypothetical protein
MNSLRILEDLNSFELIKLIHMSSMEIARLHCAHELAFSLAHLSGPACPGLKGHH